PIPEPAMMNHPNLSLTRWASRFLSLAAAIALLGVSSAARAQNVVRVDEDWELVLGAPDQLVCGPQVVTSISPYPDIAGTHFTMEINHRSLPYWTPGGIQLHHLYVEDRS